MNADRPQPTVPPETSDPPPDRLATASRPTPLALIDLESAWSIIAGAARPMTPETVSLASAPGRVLAADIFCIDDQPPFDKAMMDGFAIRAVDAATAGAVLRVTGLAQAGGDAIVALEAGHAARINTGAPLPPGADAVVRIEDSDPMPDGGSVRLRVPARPGLHVAPRGSTRRRGDIVLAAPMTLEAAQIAAAAAAGMAELAVFPEVSVAILSTGDELVPVGHPRRLGQIVDSNGPMLAALVRRFGGAPVAFDIVPDDGAALRNALTSALRHPVVLTAGGMSMGTHDLVPRIAEALGIAWRFHGVRIRPGKPVAYGVGPIGQHVFGLPGNPVSAYVCAWLFARMAIRGLQGHPVLPPHRWRATLARDLPAHRDPRPAFLPARVWNDAADGPMADACAWSGSADPFGLALANALLVIAQPATPLKAGDAVEVIFTSADP